MKSCLVPFQEILSRLLPVLALSLAGAAAMAQSGPAGLTHIEGSVAFAPAGATEWSDARPRRPVTRHAPEPAPASSVSCSPWMSGWYSAPGP